MSNLGLLCWKSMVPNKAKECHISTILTIFQYLEPDAAWWIEEFWWCWFGIIFISLARCNLWSFDFFSLYTHLPYQDSPSENPRSNTCNIFNTHRCVYDLYGLLQPRTWHDLLITELLDVDLETFLEGFRVLQVPFPSVCSLPFWKAKIEPKKKVENKCNL